MSDVKLLVRRTFDYGGQHLLAGQVIDRMYYKNDETLIKRGYLEVLDRKPSEASIRKCDKCSREFINDGYYDSHLHVCDEIDKPAVKLPPVKKLEEIAPKGIQLQHGEQPPVPVS